MSKIIMNVNLSAEELMHQVQASNGAYYWIHTVYVDQPLGNGYETIAVRCRENGSVSKKSWRLAAAWRHGKSKETAVSFHNDICKRLEELIRA